MNIRTRILTLLSIISFLFITGLLSVIYYSYYDIQIVQIERERVFHRFFRSLVYIKSQPLNLFVRYHSNHQDIIHISHQSDNQLLQEKLKSIMKSHQVNAFWVFDEDKNMLSHHSLLSEIDIQTAIDPDVFDDMFDDKRFVHYYIKTDLGIIEIRGIENTESIAHSQTDTPEYYFFAGRLWDSSYIQDIATLIQEGHVDVIIEDDTTSTPKTLSDIHGNLSFRIHFTNWDGTLIQTLRFEVIAPIIKKHVDSSVTSFLIGTLLWFAVFMFIAWAIIVWVNRPLKQISNCLKCEDPKEIEHMISEPSEFGHISRLIVAFFQQKERLKYSADHDALTAVFNRGAILNFMEKEFSRCKRNGHSMSVIMADLDKFKHVNDTYGHQAGDIVLKEAATRLKAGLRSSDWLGRYGGEEFLILVPECEAEEAAQLANRLRTSISDRDIQLADTSIRVTVSMGVSSYREETDQSGESITARADKALYQSKENGRNRVTIL